MTPSFDAIMGEYNIYGCTTYIMLYIIAVDIIIQTF